MTATLRPRTTDQTPGAQNNMSEKIAIELRNGQKTLLLPLWGRAVESRKKKPQLVDRTAADIIDKIDYDFSAIADNISEITQLAWIARSLHIDRIISQLLNNHPKATIVNLGCGLDTTFDRIDNGSLFWYDLDLPDVIALRNNFILENERRKYIACSLFNDTWFHQLRVEDAVMFIAAGLFYYFEEYQMKKFFTKRADIFPGSELLFDASSALGVRVANKTVIQGGGMDKSSILKWGIENAKSIQLWDSRIKIIDEYPLFKNMKKGLPLKNKIGTLMSDILNIMFLVHLRFTVNNDE
jgi:O-methyltransferase involved in polyketide biosynthesis